MFTHGPTFLALKRGILHQMEHAMQIHHNVMMTIHRIMSLFESVDEPITVSINAMDHVEEGVLVEAQVSVCFKSESRWDILAVFADPHKSTSVPRYTFRIDGEITSHSSFEFMIQCIVDCERELLQKRLFSRVQEMEERWQSILTN
jgi:hypothetical protein